MYFSGRKRATHRIADVRRLHSLVCWSGGLVLYYLTFVVKTSYVRSFHGHLFSSLQKHYLSSNESPALECSWGRGGGGFHIKKTEVLVGNFEKNP